MCKLAPLIGKELTERVFLDRFIDMCEDDDTMVRRICATHFGEMCTSVSKQALLRLVSSICKYKNVELKNLTTHFLVCKNTIILSIYLYRLTGS